MAFLEAEDLRVTYHPRKAPVVKALDGLSLDVPQGTVFGLLGPNGAGKSTTVKVLTTLIRADSGRARIDGIDVREDPEEIRRRIGVAGQYAAVDENLTALENLDMVGRLYHLSRTDSKRRAEELVALFDLGEAKSRPVKGFSGGMRRRIDLACALVISPAVLFLDEPTTGLDPRSRLGMWDVIESLASAGTTVLLTTQYLEEADRLADDIAVIDRGQVIARGTADELKARVGGRRIQLTLVSADDLPAAVAALQRVGTGAPDVSGDGRAASVTVAEGAPALAEVLAELARQGIELHDAGMQRPTLDDVFLRLTGHAAEDGEADETEGRKGS
ncbi:ATP-binding cassette domain-containing protein [Naasia sp. SYSU D00948]|uniref:ATP-binding cassette domain-containing protein n=1 Tax=Naasia sp. SYSU D00948 TaxID=2817379 RepID=UPI001B30DAF9|nr:ATP-binding cassette domain-containing protein [Naasia sp. SYSU D00948]